MRGETSTATGRLRGWLVHEVFEQLFFPGRSRVRAAAGGHLRDFSLRPAAAQIGERQPADGALPPPEGKRPRRTRVWRFPSSSGF
eukprot:611215-Pyramimonas_sp.AAC.1